MGLDCKKGERQRKKASSYVSGKFQVNRDTRSSLSLTVVFCTSYCGATSSLNDIQCKFYFFCECETAHEAKKQKSRGRVEIW